MWWIVQIEQHGGGETGGYGPYRKKRLAQDLADAFNAEADKEPERDSDAQPPPRAYAVPLRRRTLQELLRAWDIRSEKESE
jgi:hypothetical protein